MTLDITFDPLDEQFLQVHNLYVRILCEVGRMI